MAYAPFRLIGIANRLDLIHDAPNTAGEGRLVFALTNGPGDDPASKPLIGTVITEFELSLERDTLKGWAGRWRALSDHADFDESYRAELQALTDTYTTRGGRPSGIGQSALNQVRINEREYDWQWDLREYKLDASGLVIAPTFRSPDLSVYDTPALVSWINANEDAIINKSYETPPNLTGGASQPTRPLLLQGVKASVRTAFAEETCAGCHQLEHPAVDVNFHYSPFRSGIAKLSPFMHNPAAPDTDELAHRTKILRKALCSP